MTEIDASDSGLIEDPDEELHGEDIVYHITTFGADFTVDGLVKRFDRGDIFVPSFQRNFVWTVPQASKFVESILLGLPVPSIFLYKEDSTQKHLIVDGLQRLTTLHAFSKGRIPGRDVVFRLKDVNSRYEGKAFEDLEPEDQRRFEDAVIHAMIIQQTSPADDNSSVFYIFDRLNSNGTPLQPQEMRSAIYHGPFQEMLSEINKFDLWRSIFGRVHKRGKDQELILRFLALRCNLKSYSKPMKLFLNTFMKTFRSADESTLKSFHDEFTSTITRVYHAIGDKAFRPQRSLNVAVFDAVMVAVAEMANVPDEKIKVAYEAMLEDPKFLQMSSDATTNETNVFGRIELAIEHIRHAASA